MLRTISKESIEMIKKSPCMPKREIIGSKSMGEKNCPKKKLEVSSPTARPLFFA